MHTHIDRKKMDTLSLGVFNVISCGVLWFPGGKYTGALCGASTGKAIYIFINNRR